ncbi:MAG: DUF502 domain-containing protein [Pirellulales bacterium]
MIMAQRNQKELPVTIKTHPFRRAVLRGLAIVLPPLLTIVIFLWVGNTVALYVLEPLEGRARWLLAQAHKGEVQTDLPKVTPQGTAVVRVGDHDIVYKQLADGKFVPLSVYDKVRKAGGAPIPSTTDGIYDRYVQITYLKRYIVIPVFLSLFVVLLYLLGKFLAAGVGKFFWNTVERGIHQLPLVRNVYSSVKQVTDFMLSERDIEYTRVVAVEYPRKGIWSLGLVTGESMLDIRCAANEPVLSVLIPTSPMPVTGFTVTVKKSETVDLNLTIDQAFQFIVSCGVVVPAQQMVDGGAGGGKGQGPQEGDPKALPAP